MNAPGPIRVASFRIRQPTPVVTACYLLAGVAALRVMAAIAAFFAVPEFDWSYTERYSDPGRGHAVANEIVTVGAFSIVAAIVYLVLALVHAAGRNWARVLTWIVGSLTIVGSSIVLASAPAAVVSWYPRLETLFAWITLASMLTVLVLLALPSARRYYRPGRYGPPPLTYRTMPPSRSRPTRPAAALVAATVSVLLSITALAIVVGLIVDPPADGDAVVAIVLGVVILAIPATGAGLAAVGLWRSRR